MIGLVGNDACWSQIAREQIPLFDSDVACKLLHTGYHDIAQHYGGLGMSIDSPDDDVMRDTFKAAIEKSRGGVPVLINAIISKSDFRAGSISV